MAHVKCTIVGDAAVGKTCMIMSYIQSEFPNEYIPTVSDSHRVDINLNGPQVSQNFNLFLADSPGQYEYHNIRRACYFRADVVTVCFSLVSKSSYRNVCDRLVPEVQLFLPNIPYILVGTKMDLRDSGQAEEVITTSKGLELAERIKAVKYIECSAKNQRNVKEVFEEIVKTFVDPQRPKNKKKNFRLF